MSLLLHLSLVSKWALYNTTTTIVRFVMLSVSLLGRMTLYIFAADHCHRDRWRWEILNFTVVTGKGNEEKLPMDT